MSDYYGNARLEDWLFEDVLKIEGDIKKPDDLPKGVVNLFERWRETVEQDIENWMCSDDGDGNRLSWRGWGCGSANISDEEEPDFLKAIEDANAYIHLKAFCRDIPVPTLSIETDELAFNPGAVDMFGGNDQEPPFTIYHTTPGNVDVSSQRFMEILKGRVNPWVESGYKRGEIQIIQSCSPGKSVWPWVGHRHAILEDIDATYRKYGNLDILHNNLVKSIKLANERKLYHV